MPQLYFLCTGNACRSQMAEGLARDLLGPDWRIASAGLRADGLDSRAVAVMAEGGIDISHQYSKLIDPQYLRTSDLVITLCGDARDRCPVVPSTVKKLHWPLPDPAAAAGSPSQQLVIFRQVRDNLAERIAGLA